MRILFLAHRIPYPPNKGDKIRSWNVLRHLAAKHDVRVATLIDDAADVEYLPVLARHGLDVLHERIDQPLRKLWSLRELAASGPVTARYFHVPRLQARIDALVDELEPDAVVCSSSPTAEYVFRSRHRTGRLAAAFKVMDLMDVDSRKWAQYADGRNAAAAWLYRLEARRLADYERRIYETFDRLLLVSEQEKGLFPLEDRARKLCAMRNGVDLDYFRPRPRAAHTRPPTLVFTGMMDYWPNVD